MLRGAEVRPGARPPRERWVTGRKEHERRRGGTSVEMISERRVTHAVPRPPPVIDCARVREYAAIDDSVSFSGRTLLYVDGKELGAVHCLVICQTLNASDVLLFHCDSEWEVLGTASYNSVAEAKSRAELIYHGASSCWVPAHVSEEEASKYLDEMWGDLRCGFCGKRPDELKQLFGSGKAHISYNVITELHVPLHHHPPRPDVEYLPFRPL